MFCSLELGVRGVEAQMLDAQMPRGICAARPYDPLPPMLSPEIERINMTDIAFVLELDQVSILAITYQVTSLPVNSPTKSSTN